LATIPLAYLLAGMGMSYWGTELMGQGEFPGLANMKIYLSVCMVTLLAGLFGWLRNRGLATTVLS